MNTSLPWMISQKKILLQMSVMHCMYKAPEIAQIAVPEGIREVSHRRGTQ